MLQAINGGRWMESESWWGSFFHSRDRSILRAFSLRCSSVSLAGAAVQGSSGCDETKIFHAFRRSIKQRIDTSRQGSGWQQSHQLGRIDNVCSMVLQQQKCRTCTPLCATSAPPPKAADTRTHKFAPAPQLLRKHPWRASTSVAGKPWQIANSPQLMSF